MTLNQAFAIRVRELLKDKKCPNINWNKKRVYIIAL